MSEVNKTHTQEGIHKKSLELAKSFKKGMIPYMEEEVENFEEVVARFREGQLNDMGFMPFRLRQGVYGQRQADRQMFRIKIPGGILTPEAIEVLGFIAEKYAPLKKGHLTTRENMQFHHMSLEDCAESMRLLGEVGLSTREACGNTVRNVVGSPIAGVCPDELFDPTPYLAAYVRFGVRHPLTQNFPRKFKTSFSGCPSHDAVISLLHDFSFIAQIREENGVQKKGFRVYVGGGTSIMPRLGKLLFDFVPVEDYLRVSQAVWAVFNRADTLRKNRMMARIKVLIERIGIDALREQVEAELKNIAPIDPTPYMDVDELDRELPPQPLANASNHQPLPEEFLRWKASNSFEQKQAGYHMVYVKMPLGDIYAHQFPVLADIVRRYTGGRARVTQEQNLALRWVPTAYLYDVWQALKGIDFSEAEANTITDVVACPGTDSCKLGITSSMGLGKAIKEALASWNGLLEDPLIKKLHVKISGCPNGCAQHHIANIGFHGAAMRGPSGAQVPAYELFLGGHYGGQNINDTRYAQRVSGVKVPAKKVPEAVKEIVAFYKKNRREGEEFNQFVDRVGTKAFEAVASKYRSIPALNDETLPLYMDWDKTDVYKVERGEGECSV